MIPSMRVNTSTFRPGRGPDMDDRGRMPAPFHRGLMATPGANERGTVGGSRPIPAPKGLHRKAPKKKSKVAKKYAGDPFANAIMGAAQKK